ncbi:ABC transporter ATP-binding protein [Oscillospiraceae bacterium OttesenSCG-928-G22]|nr:ABC transporter ATP-binding protein [Oscillospiraceae bacterium OttesenSCG-928-G22]
MNTRTDKNDILSVTNLEKRYAGFTLDRISFSIPKGCIMGLIGENGAGKTTTIKAILELISIDGGEIFLFGEKLDRNGDALRGDIGVVLDEGNFPETLTAKQVSNVLSGIHDNWDGRLFFDMLRRMDVPDTRPIKDLSKGMRAKLGIASALSHNPKLLIFDEATGGLDPVVREEILDLLLEFIADEERSVLFSTHITSDLDKVADFVTFLHAGRVVFTEQKDELLERMGVLKCGADDLRRIDPAYLVRKRESSFSLDVLVNDRPYILSNFPKLVCDSATIEQIMLFYTRGKTI